LTKGRTKLNNYYESVTFMYTHLYKFASINTASATIVTKRRSMFAEFLLQESERFLNSYQTRNWDWIEFWPIKVLNLRLVFFFLIDWD